MGIRRYIRTLQACLRMGTFMYVCTILPVKPYNTLLNIAPVVCVWLCPTNTCLCCVPVFPSPLAPTSTTCATGCTWWEEASVRIWRAAWLMWWRTQWAAQSTKWLWGWRRPSWARSGSWRHGTHGMICEQHNKMGAHTHQMSHSHQACTEETQNETQSGTYTYVHTYVHSRIHTCLHIRATYVCT